MIQTQPKPVAPRTLRRLDTERKRLGITQEMVAVEAAKTSKTGTCGVPTVSAALSGSDKNANVIAALKRLIAERKQSERAA